VFESFKRAKESGGSRKIADNGATEAELQSEVDAISRVQAIIHFTPDGTILDANENFLKLMGYTLGEIVGKHHSIFADREYAQSAEYREFWAKLRRGEFDRGEYRRYGKGGKEVWLLASYNPIFDENGKCYKVVKFATDVTQEKLKNSNYEGQLEAIDRVQAVIEFDMDGKILTANRVFLDLMGYTLPEIVGRHHSIFVERGEESSEAYREFWRNLRAGREDARVYRRIRKDGRHVWLQASYNPILDLNGKPYKVVKFASDLTALIDETESTLNAAESVAAATEEMSASIAEISRNMEMSRQATGEIIEATTTSGDQASTLLASMKAMERVVGLIRGIAGRVNMLALNAAIEAARAGDAGKGFAVVATEVKGLSDQTAKATDEISREIAAVQAISAKVAETIQQTGDGVDKVSQYVSSVATAIEEQSAAMREISSHSTAMVKAVSAVLSVARRT